ncbi:unnamed protein product, partial [Mesorhabditis belari]|uniref:PH domain-containing protein n=1 Tax=Mesorhabditis belari TaxID=2138241 RepID=A0AAF3EEV3_9BILA
MKNTKDWAVSIDLSTCTKDGAIVEPHGNFPILFTSTFGVLMAADHKEMLVEWINALNKTVRNLLVWSTSINH